MRNNTTLHASEPHARTIEVHHDVVAHCNVRSSLQIHSVSAKICEDVIGHLNSSNCSSRIEHIVDNTVVQ